MVDDPEFQGVLITHALADIGANRIKGGISTYKLRDSLSQIKTAREAETRLRQIKNLTESLP